jgi:hypothetical protein
VEPLGRKDVNNSGDASRAWTQATAETAATRVNIGSRCNRAIKDKLATAWVSATEGLISTADMIERWRTITSSRDACNSRVVGSWQQQGASNSRDAIQGNLAFCYEFAKTLFKENRLLTSTMRGVVDPYTDKQQQQDSSNSWNVSNRRDASLATESNGKDASNTVSNQKDYSNSKLTGHQGQVTAGVSCIKQSKGRQQQQTYQEHHGQATAAGTQTTIGV